MDLTFSQAQSFQTGFCDSNICFDADRHQIHRPVSKADHQKLIKMHIQRFLFCKKNTATTRKALRRFKSLKKRNIKIANAQQVLKSNYIMQINCFTPYMPSMTDSSDDSSLASNDDNSLFDSNKKNFSFGQDVKIEYVDPDPKLLMNMRPTYDLLEKDHSRDLTTSHHIHLPGNCDTQICYDSPRDITNSLQEPVYFDAYPSFGCEVNAFNSRPSTPDSVIPPDTKLFQEKFFPDLAYFK